MRRSGVKAKPWANVARRGGRYPVWAHDGSVSAARRLRCDARDTRAAAVPPSAALNGPRTSRRPRRSGPFGSGLPLAPLRFSPPHKSPTPDTAHRAVRRSSCSSQNTPVPCKAVVGCAPAATYAAPSSAERMAARAQRALRDLTRRDCSSATTEGSEASFSAGHAIEQRRVPLAQRGAAASERRRIPGRGFAQRDLCIGSRVGSIDKRAAK